MMTTSLMKAEGKASILVVEDNHDLIETLTFTLERGGFLTTKAKSVREALRAMEKTSFDLVLLDVMLPDESGFELCRSIRESQQTNDVPIIFLSAKSEEIDKVVAFEMGADDYITKPFSVKELLLRINAVLRRTDLGCGPEKHGISFGSLVVDFEIPRVLVNNEEISLTSLELRLLHVLYNHRGRVQSRVQLLHSVWKIEADITTRTVDTHIKRLREKLGDACNYILTIRGIGYRFMSDEELKKIN